MLQEYKKKKNSTTIFSLEFVFVHIFLSCCSSMFGFPNSQSEKDSLLTCFKFTSSLLSIWTRLTLYLANQKALHPLPVFLIR